MARKQIPGFAVSVFLAGKYAYVADSYCPDGPSWLGPKDTGLQIFDVSDPQQPVQVNRQSLVGHSHEAQVWVRGNRAYCLLDRAMHLVDITNPIEPRILSTNEGRYLSGCLSGSYFYAASMDDSLHIYDLKNPESLELIGTYAPASTRSFPFGAYTCIDVQDAWLYAGTPEGTLVILNVSNRSKPYEISRTQMDGVAQYIQVAGIHLFLTAEDGVKCYNIADPKNPVLVGSLGLKGYMKKVQVVGKYVYVTTGSDLLIFEAVEGAIGSLKN